MHRSISIRTKAVVGSLASALFALPLVAFALVAVVISLPLLPFLWLADRRERDSVRLRLRSEACGSCGAQLNQIVSNEICSLEMKDGPVGPEYPMWAVTCPHCSVCLCYNWRYDIVTCPDYALEAVIRR